MLALSVTLCLLAQAPPLAMSPREGDRDLGPPHTWSVSGTPELSPREAWAAASRRMEAERLADLQARAQAVAVVSAPAWLPDFAVDRALRTWTEQQLRQQQPRVVEREMVVRDHGFGSSYQAILQVEAGGGDERRALLGLQRELRREGWFLLVKSGVTAAWWGILALGLFWLDRLTRGYMTGRLRIVGLGLAAILPLVLAAV